MHSTNYSSNPVNRRSFLKKSAMGFGSLASLSVLPGVSRDLLSGPSSPLYSLNPLYHKKLKVLFVIGGAVHESDTPGPCRPGAREDLSPVAEENFHKTNIAERKKQIKKWSFPDVAEILEPVDFKMFIPPKSVEFEFPESEFGKIETQLKEVDLFIVLDGLTGDICIELGKRYNKPVATIVQSEGSLFNYPGWGGWLVDMTAGTRERGIESYLAYNWDEMNRIITQLWIKKAFAETRLLIFTDRFGKSPFGMESVMYDFDSLNEMYGMSFYHATNQALADEIERIAGDPSAMKEAGRTTGYLVDHASAVHMSRQHIKNSVIAYQAVRNLMDRHDCNAFTIECREICPLEIADRFKFTPCLTHTLLKDNGYPSVCQSDVNALLAMMALMYVSRKSAYLGNPAFDPDKNILTLVHDVPGLKMKGLNEAPLPYEIRNFVHEGWGATIRYDFNRDTGSQVTLGRFNPPGNKMFLTKGHIVNGFGMDPIGCALGLDIEVKDARDIFEKMKDYGSHLVMVYGDYTNEIIELSATLGFEVESSI